MNNTSPKSASSRQLWALYCITKTDYRGKSLTYDEASALIQKFGKSDYKKKDNTVSLEKQFIDYFKKNILDDVVNEIKNSIGVASVVTEDTKYMKGTGKNGEAKRYVFRGFGCSISYFKYDRRSKKAKELDELFDKLRFGKFRDLVLKQIPAKVKRELEKEGNPIEAIYAQDFNINNTLFYGVTQFAKSIGINKFSHITNLD